MYTVSAQGVDEHMINVHYYYYNMFCTTQFAQLAGKRFRRVFLLVCCCCFPRYQSLFSVYFSGQGLVASELLPDCLANMDECAARRYYSLGWRA